MSGLSLTYQITIKMADMKSAERHAAMTWMQRLKRVFNIDIETCERCAGQVKT